MRNAIYSFYLDGTLVNNPMDWQEIQILSTFDNDNIQNNVSASEITFPLSAARQIKQWVAEGNIFEGINFTIVVSNGADSTVVGEYILDFETYRETEDRKAVVSFRYKDGLNTIADRLEAITFGWLESEGKITAADYIDVRYVVQKRNDIEALLYTAFLTAFMAKTTIDAIGEAADAIAQISSKSATGPFGPLGALIYSIARAIIAVAKAAALLIAFTKLFLSFINALKPFKRKGKAMTLITFLICST